MLSVIEFCNEICTIPQELQKEILDYADMKEYKKDELILKPGTVASHASLVLKGVVRSYYLRDGEDITTKFLQEGSMITSIYSFYSRKPGQEYIVALEDVTLASFHYDDMQQMYKKYLEFNYIGRVVTERYLFFSEIEIHNMRKTKAEDRYNFFVKHFPQLLNRVPLKYIATYLGMNIETLSRIRSRKTSLRS